MYVKPMYAFAAASLLSWYNGAFLFPPKRWNGFVWGEKLPDMVVTRFQEIIGGNHGKDNDVQDLLRWRIRSVSYETMSFRAPQGRGCVLRVGLATEAEA